MCGWDEEVRWKPKAGLEKLKVGQQSCCSFRWRLDGEDRTFSTQNQFWPFDEIFLSHRMLFLTNNQQDCNWPISWVFDWFRLKQLVEKCSRSQSCPNSPNSLDCLFQTEVRLIVTYSTIEYVCSATGNKTLKLVTWKRKSLKPQDFFGISSLL